MKGVFFDLGKTLLDNYGYDQKDAMIAIYKNTSKNIPFSEVFSKYQEAHKTIFGKAKIDNSEVVLGDFLFNLLSDIGLKHNKTSNELEQIYFFEMVKYEGLIEGAKEILEWFKANNYIIIAVSNSCISSYNLLQGMNNLGIGSYFHEVISSADILIRKPRKEIFEYAITKMMKYNVEKENMLFIGNDYKCDVIGSNEVGLKSVWFNKSREKDLNNISKLNVSNYKELINIFENNI